MIERKTLAGVVEASAAELLNPELTMQGRAAAAVRAVAKDVHRTKEDATIHAIEIFRPAAVECIRAGDESELARLIRQLLGERGNLRQANPEPTQRERWMPVMESLRWGAEIDAAFVFAPGRQIVGVRWDGMTLDDGRIVTRRELRLALKPRWSKSTDEEWLAQFGPTKELKRDAAGVEYFENDSLRG